uniref:MIF4G domain-containing protein n=1 Tax=Panagrellus redivivus TaxID=6233 RepID=A0A7E4VK82_PANRE
MQNKTDNRLRNVLNTLSHLADHGEIPVHAFGTLLRSANTEAIIEHLHQKWLSDANFSRLGAQIVFHFHTLDNHDVSSLTSGCLAHALRDYKCRDDIRGKSRVMFRNYVRTLNEFYTVYRHIDAYLAQTLVTPLFTCIETLLDDDPDDEDVKCACQILIASGHLLSEQNFGETTSIVMKCRTLLVSNGLQKSEETSNLLLAVADLWGAGWSRTRLPEILYTFHEDRGCFIDFFSKELPPSQLHSVAGSHRSRSSSGYESPARIQPLVVATGLKRHVEEPIPEGSRTSTPEGLLRIETPDRKETESVV